MTTPEVVAVILNYKRANDTIECINALQRSDYPALRILVVNNGPADGSTEEIRAKFSGLEIISTGMNLGYAGGMNVGIERGLQLGPKYLYIANSDTVAESQVVSLLVQALEERPRAAAVSPTLSYYDEPGRIWCADGEINYWRATSSYRKRLPEKSKIDERGMVSVTFISGCALLVRSSSIAAVGPFDARFFMYLEDAELSSRFDRAGYELIYLPAAVVRHKANDEVVTPFPLYFSVRNRLLFLKLGPKGLQRIVGLVYLSVVLSAKIIYWSIVKHELSRTAILAVKDYLKGNFGKGHGLVLGKTSGQEEIVL